VLEQNLTVRIIEMKIYTIITAVVVLGIVWGGLIFFLSRAFKYEKMKKVNGEE